MADIAKDLINRLKDELNLVEDINFADSEGDFLITENGDKYLSLSFGAAQNQEDGFSYLTLTGDEEILYISGYYDDEELNTFKSLDGMNSPFGFEKQVNINDEQTLNSIKADILEHTKGDNKQNAETGVKIIDIVVDMMKTW
jgi:hypothetical protein